MKWLCKKLKSIFKKKKEVTIAPFKGLKWGVIVPHTEKAKGAYGNNTNEYDYGLKLAKAIGLPYETRDAGGVGGATKRLKARGVTATLEPHKNAYNGKAKGYEILILKGDERSKIEALHFIKLFEDKYPNRYKRNGNGIKEVSKGDRGYYNLTAARQYMQVALLSEMFFIDNPHDYLSPFVMGEFWKKALNG